jgi:hypothetical protein
MSNIQTLELPSDPTRLVIYDNNNDNPKFLYKIPKLSLAILHSDIFTIILESLQLSFRDILGLCASFKIIGDSCRNAMLKWKYLHKNDDDKENIKYILNSPYDDCYQFEKIPIPNWITRIYKPRICKPPNLSSCVPADNPLKSHLMKQNMYNVMATNTMSFYGAELSFRRNKDTSLNTEHHIRKSLFESVNEHDGYCSIRDSIRNSFREVFAAVWNRIINHPNSQDIIRNMNEDILENSCKCTVNFVRKEWLVYCLYGFYDDIVIGYDINNAISNIIICSRNRLEQLGILSVENWKKEARVQLRNHNILIDNETIESWVQYVEQL